MYDIFFHPDGSLLESGERFQRKEYAETLSKIAANGPEAFYAGEIAQGIVRAVQGDGGLMTLDDLKGKSRALCTLLYRSNDRIQGCLVKSHQFRVQELQAMDCSRSCLRRYLAQCHGHPSRIQDGRKWHCHRPSPRH